MANPLTKEAGGQPVWAWGLELVGALLVYRWWQNRRAGAAATAALGTTAGLPAGGGFIGGGSGATSTAAAPPSSWSQWLDSFLSTAQGPNYTTGQAYNDATQWINGGCVSSSGFSAISNALSTLGLPPGFGTGLPALTVCPSNSTTGTSGTGTSPPTATSGYGSLTLVPSLTLAKELAAAGVQLIDLPSHTGQMAQYYDPQLLTHILHPADTLRLQAEGYSIITIGNSQYYNANQKIAKTTTQKTVTAIPGGVTPVTGVKVS